MERARFFAKKVDAALAIVDKRRVEMNVAEVMNVIGDVNVAASCLVIDDLIDTAGTLVKTAAALMQNGATRVYACASHAVLSDPAVENLHHSAIQRSGGDKYDSADRRRHSGRVEDSECSRLRD